MTYVDSAVLNLLPYLSNGDLIVGKSTVPVGTAARLATLVADHQSGAHLAWNPEFLREGHAVNDTLAPDRFVYGVDNGSEDNPAVATLDEVYEGPLSAGTPRLVTDLPTAELVKTAANSFLATKISFINAMAELCEAAGADVTRLADAIGMDDRIGRKFLQAGIGFGGDCLPKDIRAFMARAGELGADQALTFLREVDAINMRRRTRVVELTRELCTDGLLGKRITVLGAAFKPESDDVRDSPALSIAAQLQLQGAVVTVTDPKALPNAARRFPELQYVQDVELALRNADVVLLLTEWQEFRELDPHTLAEVVATPRILDGRNVLDPAKWRSAGWHYRGLGRP
jgi:UDPglucose 6-dehydrogenase